MRPKLIVSDLDDTLLRNGGTISQRTFDAVQAVRKQGIVFTACTGRMFESAMNHVRDLDIDDVIICANGAQIREISTKAVLHHRPLSQAKYRKILELAREHNWEVVTCANDGMYAERWSSWLQKYRLKYLHEPQNAVTIDILGKELYNKPLAPEKVLFIIEAPEAFEAQKILREACSEHYDIAISKPPCLEIMDKAATKGKALKWLAGHLGVKREEVLAFGDSYNDLDMIQYAGTGVAVANAIEEIKSAADACTATNNEDGVAQYLERYVLQ